MKNYNRLGRNVILWNNHEMELWKMLCQHFNDRIFQQLPSPVQPCKTRKATTSTISRTRKDVWRKCPKHEANKYITSTICGTSEDNWEDRWEILILFMLCIQHVPGTLKFHVINNLPYRTRREECKPILGLYGNPSKCRRPISRFRHDFMRRHRCVVSDWTTSTQFCYRVFLLRYYTFKMCMGAPKWPSTCKL